MNFQKKVIAAAIASAMVGSAVASTVGSTGAAGSGAVTAYAGARTIAGEAVSVGNYTVNLDGAVATPLGNALAATTIRYVPSFGLISGDIITFTFTGARFMDGDVKLVGEEAAGQQAIGAIDVDNDGDTLDVVEVASNFGTTDTTNGVTSVTLRVNNGLVLPTGIELVLQASGANLEANGDGVLNNTAENITVRIPQGTTGNIAIASSATNAAAVNIPAAANSNDGRIADIATQFTLTTTAATSTIDVSAAAGPRKSFVEEGAAGDVLTSANDSDLQNSAGSYTFSNDATSVIEDFITLDAGDTVLVSLVSSTNVDGLVASPGVPAEIEAQTGVSTGTTDDTDVNLALVAGSTTTLTGTLVGTVNLPARGAAITDDVTVYTTGTTILVNRTFNLSGVLTMDADVAQISGKSYSLTGGQSHDWTTNGTILEATYVNTTSGFNNRYVLTNSGATNAPYSTQCLVEAGNTCTLGAGATGTLNAGQTLVLNGTDVVSGVTGTGNLNRASVIFTIEAPSTTIQGVTQVVKPATGIESSHPMVRPGTN